MRKITDILPPLLWSTLLTNVKASGDDLGPIFAYFESPLIIDPEYGPIGPSTWKDMKFHNSCGGNGLVDGFGQSPIMIPKNVTNNCDRGMHELINVEPSTCKIGQLDFRVTKDGLRMTVNSIGHSHDNHRSSNTNSHNYDPICHLGQYEVEDIEHTFKLTELRIIVDSEHMFEGETYAAEFQVYGREAPYYDEVTIAFSFFYDSDENYTDPSAMSETIVSQFEADRRRTAEFCTNNTDGTEMFTSTTPLRAQQRKLICPDVTDGSGRTKASLSDEDSLENFELLPPDSGFYYYKGSLTTPPCSENIHWFIADVTDSIEVDLLERVQFLILCFVDKSSCAHASAASEFGRITRPPQPLEGRQVLHYCNDYTGSETQLEPVPRIEKYKAKHADHPYYAILFPWFISIVSVFVFYLLTRFVHGVPYTAVLFLLGTLMGVISDHHHDEGDQLSQSTLLWEGINSELLLLTFLPGLLFKDAYGLDVHLFQQSFAQCLIMGFPMVLGGTCLMALVGLYVLPYDWNFHFSMLFGAVVSATDPVAVSALLNELGAPPRLKMHIAGESLLNDGSAYVFFTIFKKLWLHDKHIHGGEDVSVGKGFEMFFKMSLGAIGIGILFGFGLTLVLVLLQKRFNKEESIVQVCATITVAYLSYYVAEVPLKLSGVISVVFCGITAKKYGSAKISDPEMMTKFWEIVEHLLNTVLFALGGVVWGSTISNSGDKIDSEIFHGKDYGYWILVYVLMTGVRFFLFGLFYPIISNIGLKSNWKEMVFQSFGGLRGAVGIALCISLENEVNAMTVREDPRNLNPHELFAVTGWIALLTLFINGILAGPILKRLKLGRMSEARKQVVERYSESISNDLLHLLIVLLGEDRFKDIDYTLVRTYVSSLPDVTYPNLKIAVRRYKESTEVHNYNTPDLSVFDSTIDGVELDSIKKLAKKNLADNFRSMVRRAHQMNKDEIHDMNHRKPNEYREISGERAVELRLLFVELLRHAYMEDMRKGEIDIQEIPVVNGLEVSIAIAEDEVHRGKEIADWLVCEKYMRRDLLLKYYACTQSKMNDIYLVHLASAFIHGHEEAQEVFRAKFCRAGELEIEEITILRESKKQISLAKDSIDNIESKTRKEIMSLSMGSILLSAESRIVNDHVEKGLLKETEGEHILERIEEELASLKKFGGRKDYIIL